MFKVQSAARSQMTCNRWGSCLIPEILNNSCILYMDVNSAKKVEKSIVKESQHNCLSDLIQNHNLLLKK